MEDKLKSLTEKLYKDGLKKGQNAADELVEKAKKKADKIIEEANAKAKLIVATAEKNASDKRTKVDSELSMSSKQVITKIKNEISSLITLKNIESNAGNAFDDKKFLQELILKIVECWSKDSTSALDINMEVPSDLKTFVESNCKKQLDKGMTITPINNTEGFKIGPKDNSYQIEFTEQSFISFFNEYLRPMTRDIIFSGQETGE